MHLSCGCLRCSVCHSRLYSVVTQLLQPAHFLPGTPKPLMHTPPIPRSRIAWFAQTVSCRIAIHTCDVSQLTLQPDQHPTKEVPHRSDILNTSTLQSSHTFSHSCHPNKTAPAPAICIQSGASRALTQQAAATPHGNRMDRSAGVSE